VHRVAIGKLTSNALADMNMSTRTVDKTKNFFALGLMYWMYNRRWTSRYGSFRRNSGPRIHRSRKRTSGVEGRLQLRGHHGDLHHPLRSQTRQAAPGQVPQYHGERGHRPRARRGLPEIRPSALPRLLPDHPASDILHELSRLKEFGVKTFQAEDEIAAICAAIGAPTLDRWPPTSTSGPGLALKTEAIGLAIMLELPLVILDVQRGGPSTGLPTKTEQADLLQAVHGRNGEAPLCVIAPATPAECFQMAYEAARLAVKYMTCHLSDRRIPRKRLGAVAHPRADDLPTSR